MFLLLSAGIDAFFTGCLTTTVDALFPDPRGGLEAHRGGRRDRPAAEGGRARPENVRLYTHQSEDVRTMSLVGGVRAADRRA